MLTHLCQDMPAAPRFLIFRGGAIGDFILTLPALQSLRTLWPEAHLSVVGYPGIVSLALNCGLVQQVFSIDAARFSAYFAPRVELPPAEKDFIRSFDVIISFLHDPNDCLRTVWQRAGARQVICLSPQVSAGHAVDHYLRVLEALGVKNVSPAFGRLVWPDKLQAMGRAILKSYGLSNPVFAIHPGSGSARKNWPLSAFLALAKKVIQETTLGYPLWITGEAETSIVAHLEKNNPDTSIILKGRSLLETASVLSVCQGYVGNDSGITHLAAALGIPTVALFGPTDPAVWRPRGLAVSVMRSWPPTTQGLAKLSVESVFKTILSLGADTKI